MATIEDLDLRTIIDDARARHAALVALIYSGDAQAMGLLRLYATLGIATVSGAIAGFSGTAAIATPLAAGLAGAAAVLLTGVALCLRAVRPTEINLPGRSSDFWRWALEDAVTPKDVVSAYLANLDERRPVNQQANRDAATALKWAKRCAAVAPVAAAVTAAATYLLRA